MTSEADKTDPKLTPERLKELWDLADRLIAAEKTFVAFLKIRLERQAIRDFVIGLGPSRRLA